MSRKHFVALAQEISKIQDARERQVAAEAVANACAEHNDRFDRQRFLQACGAIA